MKRKTLLNGESGHLALMLVLSVATQCVALLKSTVTASAFGASMEMDAYNFSNNIILFLFSFLSSGITAVVIPAYVQKRPGEVTDSFLTFLKESAVNIGYNHLNHIFSPLSFLLLYNIF